MKIGLIIITTLFLFSGCKSSDKAADAPLIFQSAEDCRDCHERFYDEWKESMHAKSTPMSDKIHAAIFKISGNDIKTGTKDGKVPGCYSCHAPIAALDGEVDLTKKPVYSEGITCTYCHKIQALKKSEERGVGAHAYQYHTGDTYASAIENPRSDAHDTDYHPLFSKSAFCSGCHERRNNEMGVSLCNTYEEYKESRRSKYMQCQNCHMSSYDGRAASSSDIPRKLHFHGSSGGRNIDMLKSAVEIDITLSGDKKIFNVIIKNTNAAHKMPTAAPMRQLFLKVVQLDSKGGTIMENFRQSPLEDKKAFFVVSFEDADGNVGAPPWKAAKISFDNRLQPDEERIVMYDFAGVKVKTIRAELYYRLVPPELTKDNDFDDYTNKSHLVAQDELKL